MNTDLLLAALRTAATWDDLAAQLGVGAETARTHVYDLLRSRVPAGGGEVIAFGVDARITRDAWGIPHVAAGSEAEAYYGLGFAMAQDRLWQMDYLRRVAYGTLAEVLGPGALEGDRLARTLNFRGTAEQGVVQTSEQSRTLLEYFCGGVNLARTLALRDGLPIEFSLLEYDPEAWTPADSQAVLRAFWWQLTGRFQILCLPEFVRRTLGEGPLFEALFQPEGGRETIWPRDVPHPDLPRWGAGSDEEPLVADGAAPGSNNWVVGASRAAGGSPILASDPHVPIVIPSVWYEAHLAGGALEAAGATYVGVPGIFFGRNRDVAWGLTNNISLLRDLYLEETDPAQPSHYRRPEGWKELAARRETIRVRGAADVELVVQETDHGPVVSDLLPGFARTGEVVSVRWVGQEPTEELEAMLGYARAATVPEFREHLRKWHCPTFNWMIADRERQIGYQLTGKIPLRREEKCRYRHGADPLDRWVGYVPFEALPATGEPPEGWLGSANNIVAVDWPYPLAGTWPSDYRMQRLVGALNEPGLLSREAMEALQYDALSPRAVEWAAPAVAALRAAGLDDPLLDEIAAWDGRYAVDSRPAVVFESFFVEWARQVLTLRLPPQLLTYLFPASIGLVEQLWLGDPVGWFEGAEARHTALRTAWSEALAGLEGQLGVDREAWSWGRAHVLVLRHPLGATPLLTELFQRGPVSHPGTWNTLNNSLYDPNRLFETTSGVSYRLLVDLAGPTQAVTPGGQSGHPGSPHYDDQLPLWAGGAYHPLELGNTEGEHWVLRSE